MTEFESELELKPLPKPPLPKGWTTLTLQAILHVIALARIVILNASHWPTVQAWYPDHVWSVDLTVVPSTDGLWVPWPPKALTQIHPYSWYVMVVIDHDSRRIMGFDVFEQQPDHVQNIRRLVQGREWALPDERERRSR
ncbi:MAG: hypothetical protein FWH27_11405 [Planctomycetaceae bacterium]|nr:hypothetical protein [Planctomycetaceae bacterium]